MNKSLHKVSFFVVLMAIFLLYSFTQGTVWMDENHHKTSEKNGVYYRPAPQKKKSNYYIIDYYKNGNKYREGLSESSAVSYEKFKGTVSYYHRNGLVSKKENFKKGVKQGSFKEYFYTGELKIDGGFDNGKKNGVWKIYYKTGKIKSKGKYRDGQKVGVWKTYYKNVYYPEEE